MKNKKYQKINRLGFLAAVIFFVFFIFIPAIFILSKVWDTHEIFSPAVLRAVLISFFIGLIVTLINLIFGLPLAWMLARGKSWVSKWLDNLIDLSLVVPTAALGFSIYLYWGSKHGIGSLFGLEGLVSKGVIMIILLHIVFTIPYMIRSIAAAISHIDIELEEAAATLGANPFTAFRTISLPLFKDGVIVGSILSFTRSLSETGATMMVAGAVSTAPVLIVNLKNSGDMPGAAGASIFLILSALAILFFTKLLLREKTIKLERVYPNFEKSLIKLKPILNIILILFFIIIIFLPTIFIILYNIAGFNFFINLFLLKSLAVSFILAFIVTVINLVFSAPLAYLIARNLFGLGKIIDSMNEVVLLVPTSALGLSLVLFWKNIFSNEFIILLLTHLSFTFPLLVKPLTAAFKEIPHSLEEAAYTLGANTKKMFLSILLPLIKPAIIAGCIMAFMRSLSETGATLAVSKNINTIPILIVDLVNRNHLSEAAFACAILFVVSLVFLFILKYNKASKA